MLQMEVNAATSGGSEGLLSCYTAERDKNCVSASDRSSGRGLLPESVPLGSGMTGGRRSFCLLLIYGFIYIKHFDFEN